MRTSDTSFVFAPKNHACDKDYKSCDKVKLVTKTCFDHFPPRLGHKCILLSMGETVPSASLSNKMSM